MPIGMCEGERFIQKRITLKEETHGYPGVFFTTDSTDVSIAFGLCLGQPLSDEAKFKINFAMTFLPASRETERVVRYFCNIALETGWFVALPADEIPIATNGQLSQVDLNRAVEEGYLQIEEYPGVDTKLAEVTLKLAELVNPNLTRTT